MNLEIITGPMFSGKSEELIRRVKRCVIAGQKVQVFKPDIDKRYNGIYYVTSHDERKIDAIPIASSEDIMRYLYRNTEVVGLDEIQFIDDKSIDVIDYLVNSGIRVIVACLNMDFRGEPFPFKGSSKHVGGLFVKSDSITKLASICTHKTQIGGESKICGKEATFTQRIINGKPATWNSPTILIGAKEAYEARCRKHFVIPGKPEIPLTKFISV